MSGHWQPSASLETLKQAARLRSAIHRWMQENGILEVFTPPLSHSANTDPHVESLLVPCEHAGNAGHRYLHTSPEFAMKRILCAYPETDLYQMATVFRAEVQGRFHVSQFTMLEWYRTGMDHVALMQDVQAFLESVWESFEQQFPGVEKRSYCEEVYRLLGHWPDALEGVVVRDYFLEHQRSFPEDLENDIGASLDLFIDEFVLSEFDPERFTFLYDYPASQAALARIGSNPEGQAVAQRFEVFFGKLELANGFHELSDPLQQRQRFETDQQIRRERKQLSVPLDENLLDALAEGLPDCAGIAFGIERLQMVLGRHAHINQVMAFCDDNA